MIVESNPLYRDLLRRHVGPFLFCFFSIMFILLMQFLILHADKLIGKGLPAGVIIELILTNLAYMVVMAVPMSVLVSSLMAFGRFSEWNEWTALRAAGVHPYRLMAPMVGIAVLLTAGLSVFSNRVLPESNQKARALFIDIRMKKPGFDLNEGAFYDGIDGYTFFVREIDATTDSLHDVFLYQMESGDRELATIKAQKGFLQALGEDLITLTLEDGALIRWLEGPDGREKSIEEAEFSRYRISFDLSSLAFSRSNPNPNTRNDRTLSSQAMRVLIDSLSSDLALERSGLFDRSLKIITTPAPILWRGISPTSIPAEQFPPYLSRFTTLNSMSDPIAQNKAMSQVISNLERYISDLERFSYNTNQKESQIAEYLVEVYKKTSIPFACILFILIGAPIGLLTRKGNIGLAAVISSLLLTLYFVGVIQGEKFADRLLVSPWWGMWGVNVVYAILAAVLLRLVVRPLPSLGLASMVGPGQAGGARGWLGRVTGGRRITEAE